MSEFTIPKPFAPLMRAVLQHGWKSGPLSDELFSNIDVRIKDGNYLYNYNDKHLVPRDHPLIVRCRGLVVSEGGEILNYPFDRFFNDFEPEGKSTPLNWSTAEIQEKLDGSLICVWYDPAHSKWEITTRGSFYPQQYGDKEWLRFDQIFLEVLGIEKIGTWLEAVIPNAYEFCYMFELVTELNRNITWYDENKFGIYLIGARDLNTFKEVSQGKLDDLAHNKLALSRPDRFRASDRRRFSDFFLVDKNIAFIKPINASAVRDIFSTLKDDEEGFVVVDANHNRLKIKQDTYFKLNRIKMLQDKDIFDYVIGKTELDAELLHMLPDVVKRIETITGFWTDLQQMMEDIYNQLKNIESDKEFAIKALRYPFNTYLFAKRRGKFDKFMKNLKYKVAIKW